MSVAGGTPLKANKGDDDKTADAACYNKTDIYQKIKQKLKKPTILKARSILLFILANGEVLTKMSQSNGYSAFKVDNRWTDCLN